MKTIDGNKITYDDSPSCEHCGDNHKPFAASILVDSIWWCLDCYCCGYRVTDEKVKAIVEKERQQEIKWHKKRIKEIENEK